MAADKGSIWSSRYNPRLTFYLEGVRKEKEKPRLLSDWRDIYWGY